MLGCIGECMLEMSHQSEQLYRLGYGGDVFNTAVYCSRLGAPVGFLSATGDDSHSLWLMDAWQNEGVNVDNVRIIPEGSPSLYTIENDTRGEKQFSYWRTASPFKRLLVTGEYRDHFSQMLQRYTAVYFSGISLALLDEPDREFLLQCVKQFRDQGGMVAYDPNYRSKLWSAVEAKTWNARAYQVTDIALPSLEDASTLTDDVSIDDALAAAAPATERVLKCGAQGVELMLKGEKRLSFPLLNKVTAIDTTAAGDSFNAGYLAARLRGQDHSDAVRLGQSTAAQVVQYRGAIIPAADWQAEG